MALRNDYRKARRNLVLTSAILLAWQAAIKRPGPPDEPISVNFGGVHFQIVNKVVIAYSLALLTVYFLYRFNLEWRDTARPDEKSRLARLDYRGTAFFSLVAIQAFCFIEIWNA